MSIATILRAAITKSGKSQNELAKLSGVPQPRVNAFMNGGGLRLEHAGALMEALGLQIVAKPVAKSKRKP